ncbi:MAG: WD40 repeat domain-containing protein [Pseudomonadota bacterium]
MMGRAAEQVGVMKKVLLAVCLMIVGGIAAASLWLIYRPGLIEAAPVVYQTVLGTPQPHSAKEDPPGLALDLVFDDSRDRLFSRQVNGTIRLWSLAGGQPRSLAQTDGLFAFCPEKQRLLLTQNGTVQLLEIGTNVSRPFTDGPFRYGAWDEDCDRVAIAHEDTREVELWDGEKGSLLAKGETTMPVRNGLALSDDGVLIAAATGRYTDQSEHVTAVQLFQASAEGRLTDTISYGQDYGILGLWRLIITPRAQGLLVGSQSDGRSGLMRLSTMEEKVAWRHDGFASYWVRALAVSSTGDLLATGDEKGFLRLWNARSGEKLYEGQSGLVIQSLDFSADGSKLAVGLWNSTIGIVDVTGLVH